MDSRKRPQETRPPLAHGVFVYPVSASNSNRTDERRRNSRLRVPSIMYAQLGSTCGGIVVNLSLDGVSCLTAIRLPAASNLSFDMKLRGAGLNVELTGEVVWLGATQKKAGIRFKDVSPEAHKEISEWIVRESQLFGPVGMDPEPATSGPSGFSAASQSHVARALSLTPDASRDGSQASDADDEEEDFEGDFEPPSAALLKPTSVQPRTAPFQPRNTSADNSGESAVAPNSASRPRNDALFEPISAEKPYQFPTASPLPPATAQRSAAPVRAVQAAPSPKPIATTDFGKTQNTKRSAIPSTSAGGAPATFSKPYAPAPVTKSQPVAAAPVSRTDQAKPRAPETARPAAAAASAANAAAAARKSPAAAQDAQSASKTSPAKNESPKSEKNSAAITAQPAKPVAGPQPSQAAVRWIPPAILELWQTGDRTQKIVVAGLGIACVGSFILILILTGVHMVNSSNSTGQRASTASVVRDVAVQNNEAAVDTTEPAAADPDQPPPASPFMYIVNLVFGSKDDSDLPFLRHQVAIDPAHVAVQVWTSKPSGYYYCTDNELYKTMQPGSFMSQRDALQGGYQPKLGKFCN